MLTTYVVQSILYSHKLICICMASATPIICQWARLKLFTFFFENNSTIRSTNFRIIEMHISIEKVCIWLRIIVLLYYMFQWEKENVKYGALIYETPVSRQLYVIPMYCILYVHMWVVWVNFFLIVCAFEQSRIHL